MILGKKINWKKIISLGKVTNGYCNRIKKDSLIYSTESYSGKFKANDSYFTFNGNYFIIKRFSIIDETINIICSKIEVEKISENQYKFISESSIEENIEASLLIKKMVYVKFSRNIFLSFLSYDIMNNWSIYL